MMLVELLRVMLNYAVDERMITPDQNPFSQRSTRAMTATSIWMRFQPPGGGRIGQESQHAH
jgi:hypothetical protein